MRYLNPLGQRFWIVPCSQVRGWLFISDVACFRVSGLGLLGGFLLQSQGLDGPFLKVKCWVVCGLRFGLHCLPHPAGLCSFLSWWPAGSCSRDHTTLTERSNSYKL